MTHSLTVPAVLRYRKDGRGAIHAFKLVRVAGEVVLAQAVRHQVGTRECVSIPLSVLAAARSAGAFWYVWRNDRLSIARRLPLSEAERRAVTLRGGELYFRLTDLEPVPPPSWEYTETIVEVPSEGVPRRGEGRQLALPLFDTDEASEEGAR